MLVLSRKVGQSVRIGEDIVVTVIKAKDGSLRLGIEAPKHVKVLRDDAVATEPADDPLVDPITLLPLRLCALA